MMEDTKPWYRLFWPWVLIAIPAASVAGSMLMIHLAISGHDGVVREYYRKDRRGVLEDLSHDQRAAELGLEAEVEFDSQTGGVQLHLSAQRLTTLPDNLELLLVHPTRAHGDLHVVLTHLRDGHYAGRLEETVQGPRTLQLVPTGEQWRLKYERAYFPLRESLALRPIEGQ